MRWIRRLTVLVPLVILVLGVRWWIRLNQPSDSLPMLASLPAPPSQWTVGEEWADLIPHRIVFASDMAGSFDLYLWNRGKVTPILQHPADDSYPTVSPDGRWIAFQRRNGRQWDIYLLDLQRGTVRPLVASPHDEQNPAWFPDSRRVVFDSDAGRRRQLFIVDIETGNVQQLTKGLISRNVLPAVAPDGRRIALTSSAWVGWSVAILQLPTGSMDVLVRGASCRPDWAPNGRALVITTQKFDGKGDIALLDLTTGRLENLTPDRPNTYDYDPRWSPDGRWIVFQTTTDKHRGNWQIWVLDRKTGRKGLLIDSPGADMYPFWWPQGSSHQRARAQGVSSAR